MMERLASTVVLALSIGAAGAVTWKKAPTQEVVVDVAPPVPALPEVDHDDLGVTEAENHIKLTPLSLDLAWAGRSTVHERPEEYPDDCSRFVGQIVRKTGVPMRGRVSMLWQRAQEYDVVHYNPYPWIGDLVFFDNTYDSNRNGRWDDHKTHIALVTDVDPDGTITLVHWGGRRQVVYMNLIEPHTHEDAQGKVLNSYLRTPRRGYPRTAMYLAGQLWSGFATVSEGQDWVALAAWER